MDEGVDIVSINALIMAAGGKSQITTLQRIGRGLRHKKGENTLLVLDFLDKTNSYLEYHSKRRMKICKDEGFKIILLKEASSKIAWHFKLSSL